MKTTKRWAAALLALALICAAGCAPAEETVLFGRYEQNGDPSDGPEPIEWLVLEARDGKTLLLASRALDVRAFHTQGSSVTWEKCALRAWLNGTFFDTAFDEAEQARILLTEVDNSKPQSHWECIDGGPWTRDRVFLLSFAEAEAYFPEDSARICVPTAYAAQQGARGNSRDVDAEGNPSCWWWLRSPGFYRYYAASVLASGALTNLSGVAAGTGAVRPVIWVADPVPDPD